MTFGMKIFPFCILNIPPEVLPNSYCAISFLLMNGPSAGLPFFLFELGEKLIWHMFKLLARVSIMSS